MLLRPLTKAAGVDQLRLEPIDAAHKAAEQRARVATIVVVAQGQLTDPLGQHREPIALGEGDLRALVPATRKAAQHGRCQLRRGQDQKLAVAPVEALLERGADGVRARRCGQQHGHALGWRSLPDMPAETVDEQPCLAAASRPEHQQRAAGVDDELRRVHDALPSVGDLGGWLRHVV